MNIFFISPRVFSFLRKVYDSDYILQLLCDTGNITLSAKTLRTAHITDFTPLCETSNILSHEKLFEI